MSEMARVAAVAFDHVQGPQYFRVQADDLPPRVPMVGLTRFGMAVGELVRPPYEAETNLPPDPATRATTGDLERAEANRQIAAGHLGICEELVERHELPMKLARAFLALDRRQLTFFYAAPHRVDFRDLLRDLVRQFRTQIRLEQVGDRDIGRLIGGLGRCGRELCCCSWMSHFEPISIAHAREQGLPPAPSQLAGLCGRLRCCLRFELDDDSVHADERSCTRRKPVKTASYHSWYDEDDRDPRDYEG